MMEGRRSCVKRRVYMNIPLRSIAPKIEKKALIDNFKSRVSQERKGQEDYLDQNICP